MAPSQCKLKLGHNVLLSRKTTSAENAKQSWHSSKPSIPQVVENPAILSQANPVEATAWWYQCLTCCARTRAAANAWLWWASCGLAACNREGQGGGKWAKKGVKQAHLGKFAHAAYSPASHAALNSRLLAATLATRQGATMAARRRAPVGDLSAKSTVVFDQSSI